MERLAADPFASPHVRKIAGVTYPAYRLRVGRWHVLYLLITEDKTIEAIELFLKTSQKEYRKFVSGR
ncbi:type II toxin-antitoxin system RelE/ParE family toxin [Candidatus Uhrbacteria bacterium]|nr:type II toxin-antitoxin system RelE/ParE family toxin [Candidatus Uhrbacteria bacterium]